MALFRELNDGGQTVVMVTHNPDNGHYADRTIFLRDGVVVDDRINAEKRTLAVA
jgi:putative ABC transport system ATP-binding protein